MSLRPVVVQSGKLLLKVEPCIFCQLRQFVPRYAKRTAPQSRPWARNYTAGDRKTPQQARVEIDKRSREAFFRHAAAEGIIAMKPKTADDIIEDFSSQKNGDPRTRVVELAKKYGLQVADITALAIAIYRVPDVKDQHQRLPPSQHKTIAGLLLVACSKAKDPRAILHILTAVHLSASQSLPAANGIARLFGPADVAYCRRELQELALKNDPDAMTLLGQLLETEGQRQQARTLYEKALELKDPKFVPVKQNSMALPLIPPWNALGFLLLADKDPKAREQARAAFGKGAVQGDDPLSYFYLASFEKAMSGDWLKYMSKAAASGHVEAMYNIGNFYMDVDSDKKSFLEDIKLANVLAWLTKWKRGAPKRLAMEWFEAAAQGGHKPSMLELAELSELEGDTEKSKSYLRSITEPPPAGKSEEWPRLVEDARKRLMSLS